MFHQSGDPRAVLVRALPDAHLVWSGPSGAVVINSVDAFDPYHSHPLFSVLHQNQQSGFEAFAGGPIGATNGAQLDDTQGAFDSLFNFDINEYLDGSNGFSATQYSHPVPGEHSNSLTGIPSESVFSDML